ncbi:MAG TPA: peroxidase [Terriglobia bacterium]|nr:peroxidase [Terriglobia bacterium]
MSSKLKPMFLPDVENNPAPGPHAELIRTMQAAGQEYPQIWHLFAYRPQATGPLGLFTQDIMREACPLSPGLRELIAAFTSSRNHCPF